MKTSRQTEGRMEGRTEGQKDGQKEGKTLFYRTLPASMGGPIKNIQNNYQFSSNGTKKQIEFLNTNSQNILNDINEKAKR